MERTYIMIKPDGVQRNLVGEIIARFEKKGYKLAALKVMHFPSAQSRAIGLGMWLYRHSV